MALPLALLAGAVGAKVLSSAVAAGANVYSQAKQREFYRYQNNAYDRQYADWKRNVPGRQIRYPELSFPGRRYANDIGISQSYASTVGTIAGAVGSTASGISRAGSLYNNSVGRSSRYL